ncbi:MAG: FHA domain-containing protein [Solirubrobacteraceae bacterium]
MVDAGIHRPSGIVAHPPAALAPLSCPNPACLGPIDEHARSCSYCGHSLGADRAWQLDILGRRVVVTPGQSLLLGRDETSPLAGVLENRTNISRRHCELLVQGGLQIRDVGSANGTFVDGQPIGRDWRRFPPGGTLRLASDLLIDVIEAP